MRLVVGQGHFIAESSDITSIISVYQVRFCLTGLYIEFNVSLTGKDRQKALQNSIFFDKLYLENGLEMFVEKYGILSL